MNRSFRALAALALALLLALPATATEPLGGGPASAVKGFFHAVAQKQYGAAWKLLSESSKATICQSIARDEKMDAGEVRRLFESNDVSIQNGFWESFRVNSKCEVLAGSVFQSGAVDGNRADVTVRGASAVFRAVREQGSWRFGLMETFPPEP